MPPPWERGRGGGVKEGRGEGGGEGKGGYGVMGRGGEEGRGGEGGGREGRRMEGDGRGEERREKEGEAGVNTACLNNTPQSAPHRADSHNLPKAVLWVHLW